VGVEAWVALVVTVTTVAMLASERGSPPVILVGAVTVLLVLGVIDADQALSGFSNPAPISVAALYVLAAGTERTGLLDVVTTRVLRTVPSGATGDRSALVRILFSTAAASAFLNNTPIVAMVAPAVISWARRTGRAASPYLMPVSFAAILGGVTTLIGTSTNLVVSGLMEDSGQRPMGLFEIGAVGLPVAAAGMLAMSLLAFRLLPERRAPSETVASDVREFTVEMVVEDDSSLVGRTVAEANLRGLEGVYLVQVERDGRPIAPVSTDEVLVAGDRLAFAGNVGRVLDLHRVPGLTSAEKAHFSVTESSVSRLYEAVVAEDSPLAGSTLKDVGFRARYGAAVLAIHRAGERLPAKLGEVVLRPGDVLLVLAGPGFKHRWKGGGDFLVLAALNGDTLPRTDKARVVGLVLAGLLLTVGTGLLDILEASLLSGFALVVFKVLTPNEARRAIDVNIVVVIAASFGLGAAISESGLAEEIAGLTLEPLGALGDIGLLLGVLLATIVLTELITNNAAAILMFPIAMAAAAQAGLDPRPFAFALALGASASFLTPIGYQTNTMVYGMGGYRFGDFARLGAPLTAILIALSLLLIPAVWELQ
jgi:di/tricarboxylate transporter